ncbi:MAG: nitroreductase [Hyphomonadaceae bacterium]|nr:nitroreductase [Hyphomonadaceae bacterium]MBC6412386.1 nitroreductase [Hyphomonadaceae bacterium]
MFISSSFLANHSYLQSQPEGIVVPSLPQNRPEIIDFLADRRSSPARLMRAPGPNAEQLETILTIGARVPDHRKLAPWRFIVIQGEARTGLGRVLGEEFGRENPDTPQDRIEFETERLLRAPLVIVVISSPVNCQRGTPKWEQELSAGAVCFNLCLAAQAYGFGAQWLTEWYAYNAAFCNKLGLKKDEKIAGFIYIGRVDEKPGSRTRPNIPEITEHLS